MAHSQLSSLSPHCTIFDIGDGGGGGRGGRSAGRAVLTMLMPTVNLDAVGGGAVGCFCTDSTDLGARALHAMADSAPIAAASAAPAVAGRQQQRRGGCSGLGCSCCCHTRCTACYRRCRLRRAAARSGAQAPRAVVQCRLQEIDASPEGCPGIMYGRVRLLRVGYTLIRITYHTRRPLSNNGRRRGPGDLQRRIRALAVVHEAELPGLDARPPQGRVQALRVLRARHAAVGSAQHRTAVGKACRMQGDTRGLHS